MDEIRFLATVGDDQAIRPPAGTPPPEGPVEVTVRPARERPSGGADLLAPTRAWLLAMVEEAEAIAPGLPSDLAESHDHDARGKPRP